MQGLRIIALVALAAAALPPAAPAQESDAPKNAVTVVVDAVRSEPLSQTFTVIGRLVARQRGVVATRARGAVAALTVQVGERVREGDVLAVIDRARLAWRRDLARAELKESRASLANAEARIASAEARVASAEARLAMTRQELARLEKLRKSAAFSQARFDDKRHEVAVSRSEVDEARAEVQEAVSLIDQSEARIMRSRANLSIAEDDVANAEVRAPFDGVVTLRHTEAGAFLEVGDDVVTLVNDGDLEIEADVPYDRLVGIAPGVEIALRLDDGSRHQASVRAIGVEENPKTRTRRVRFTPRFADGVLNLADGQSAALDLPIGKPRTVISVHKDAVIRGPGETVVYVVADGVAEERPVELGEAIGTRFEVLSGLAVGELVVVRGNERLVPGQAVTTFGESS